MGSYVTGFGVLCTVGRTKNHYQFPKTKSTTVTGSITKRYERDTDSVEEIKTNMQRTIRKKTISKEARLRKAKQRVSHR